MSCETKNGKGNLGRSVENKCKNIDGEFKNFVIF